MKNFNVHMGFYDEKMGEFDYDCFRIEAENQFEARRIAWSLCENNEDYAMRSGLKILGVNWTATDEPVMRSFVPQKYLEDKDEFER